MRDAPYPARVCTPFSEMANSKFAPPYGEFDTVGFVCSVGPAPYVSSITFLFFEFFSTQLFAANNLLLNNQVVE